MDNKGLKMGVGALLLLMLAALIAFFIHRNAD